MRYVTLMSSVALEPAPLDTQQRPSAGRPTAVDLFCGAGGLSLGFEQAGFDILAAVEYDPVHALVYRHNLPLTPVVCTDVRALTRDKMCSACELGAGLHSNPWPMGVIDVVIGGPPCQGFSSIGRRQQLDPRNYLVHEFARWVCEIRPRYFVMENVPGLARAPYKKVLYEAVAHLESEGYKVVSPVRLLNASDYGVPQDRTRTILIGWNEGETPIEYPPPQDSEPPTVWDAIGDLAELCNPARVRAADEIRLTDRELISVSQKGSKYAARLRVAGADSNDHAWAREWDEHLLTNVRSTVHAQAVIDRFAATSQGDFDAVSRYRRLRAKGLANTLRAGSGRESGSYTSPRPIHPHQNRVITVREAARLHSFPDWFRFHTTIWHGFRQIGNAVPPLLARRIGEAVVAGMGCPIPAAPHAVALGRPTTLSMAMSEAAAYFLADEEHMPGRDPRDKKKKRGQPASQTPGN